MNAKQIIKKVGKGYVTKDAKVTGEDAYSVITTKEDFDHSAEFDLREFDEVIIMGDALTKKMNMKFGAVEGAHVIKNVNLGLNAYESLCLICSELNIDLSEVADSDFESAAIVLDEFCKAANDETGYTVSVWFDAGSGLDVVSIFNRDERIAYVVEYQSGWVSNSYKWRAPGSAKIYYRDGKTSSKPYDRKRPYGMGPRWVAFSEKHGRLASD